MPILPGRYMTSMGRIRCHYLIQSGLDVGPLRTAPNAQAFCTLLGYLFHALPFRFS